MNRERSSNLFINRCSDELSIKREVPALLGPLQCVSLSCQTLSCPDNYKDQTTSIRILALLLNIAALIALEFIAL